MNPDGRPSPPSIHDRLFVGPLPSAGGPTAVDEAAPAGGSGPTAGTRLVRSLRWLGLAGVLLGVLVRAQDAPVLDALDRATAIAVRGWGPGSSGDAATASYVLGQVVDMPVFTAVQARADGQTADGLLGTFGAVVPGSIVSFQASTDVGPNFVSVVGSDLALTRDFTDALSSVGVACGEFHTLLLKRNGTVVGRGWNGLGQSLVPEGLDQVTAIGCGVDHSVAILANGRAVLWGRNDQKQAEVEESENHGFVAGTGGLLHTVLLRTDGSIHITHPLFRAESQGLPPVSDAVAVAAGAAHTVVLHRDGRVTAFGRAPALVLVVPAAASGAVSVAAGGYFSLALKPDGRVVAWGDHTHGQLAVPASATNVIAVAAGSYHAVALCADGRVVAWGEGSNGATAVPSGLTGVMSVAAGGYHTQVLVRKGPAISAPRWNQGVPVADLFLAAGTRFTLEQSVDLRTWRAGPMQTARPGALELPIRGDGPQSFWRLRERVGARGAE